MTAVKHLLLIYAVAAMTAPFMVGCSQVKASVTPNSKLSQSYRYFIIHHAADGRGINMVIRDEFANLGYNVQTGTEAEKPANADVLVTYEDRWRWDLTMYMLSLDLKFRNSQTQDVLATGRSYHPSLERKEPAYMAREVLISVLKEAGQPVPPVPK